MTSWNAVDKSAWPDGPWQKEPDKVHWVDKASDMDCLLVRGPMGAWCGYVGVTEGHPLFGKDYDEAYDLDVHGGLTFARFCAESEDPAVGVCHVPLPGRPHKVWWLGFDAAHGGDIVPTWKSTLGFDISGPWASTYKTTSYMKRECRELAKQLRAMQEV